MKWEVKLYVGGQVFVEDVRAVNYSDAKETAMARNPKAKFISANPIPWEMYIMGGRIKCPINERYNLIRLRKGVRMIFLSQVG